MALTILEAAKMGHGTVMDRAVVNIYARSSEILRVLPFRDIEGNALGYNREEVLPGVAFRGINEGYTASTGILNPVVETLTIIGGDIEVDNFIIKTEGESVRSTHEAMKLKAIAQDWQTGFFKGDVDDDEKEFDGLQKRLTGNQLIDNGSSSGGDALSLAALDEVLDACLEPTHIAMNKTMRRRLTAAARDQAVGGEVNFVKDEFGRQVTTYNGLEILVIEDANGQNNVLPFTEANPGGGVAASTSIYVMSFGPERVEGIQNGGIDARDIGERESKPTWLTRVEWYAGITIKHGRAASRLRGITNSAVLK